MTPPTQPSPPRARGALAKKLATLAASLALSILILEAYARLTWHGQWFVPRSAAGVPGIFSVRLKPGLEIDLTTADDLRYHVSTNARGFRGPLVSSIADRPLRVVSVGDSFMFSWGLPLEDHAMARFVDAYAAAHPDRGIGHAFVATPGWDPKDYYFAYMTEVLPTQADVVVLGFFPGNDILPPTTPRVLDPEKAPWHETLAPLPPEPRFRFVPWMSTLLSSSLLVTRLGVRFGYKPPTFARFDRDAAAEQKAWEATFFYLGGLADAVQKNGGRLVILSFPSSVQVNAGRAIDAAGMDHAMPERIVAGFCKQRGIDLILMLPSLEAQNQHADLFFPKDRHLSRRGQEVVAEVLGRELGPIVDQVWAEKQRRAHGSE